MNTCPMCLAPFAPSHRGGPERRFCSAGCQRSYNAALRAYGRALVDAGFLDPITLGSWWRRRATAPCTAGEGQDA